MKKIFTRLFTGGALLFSVTAFAQLTPEVLYYKFDGAGTSVPNYASAPPAGTDTATIMGGLVQSGGGICGGSLVGTGNSSANDYMNTGWVTSMTGSWTISFRTSNVPSTTSTYYILGDVNAGQLRVFTGGAALAGNWILRGPLTDVYAYGGASTGPSMTTFVYDAVANTITSYVNGVVSSTVAQPAGGVTLSGSGPFEVGGYASSACLPSGSLMDEFRFYSRALTQAEITQLYNPFTPSGFLGADQSVCPGSNPTLSLNWPYQNVLWSTGDTTGSISVSTPGIYTVDITGACGTGSDTIAISSLESYNSLSPSACGSYIAPSGNTLSVSGTYIDTIPNVAGCDSLITINLTVNQPSSSSLTASACDSYTAPSGATYTSTGTYTDIIPNAVGCDSVITINLTVTNSTYSFISPEACGTYNSPAGNTYTSSGTYTDVIPNMAGCDSVITINLTIDPLPNVTLTVSPSSACVTDGNYTLTGGSPANGTYSGPGVGGGIFSPATAGVGTQTITYVYTDQNGCSSSATDQITVNACTGIAEQNADGIGSIYPNPNNGTFNLDFNADAAQLTVRVLDVEGRVVYSESLNGVAAGTTKQVSLENLSNGVYFLQLVNGDETSMQKFVISK